MATIRSTLSTHYTLRANLSGSLHTREQLLTRTHPKAGRSRSQHRRLDYNRQHREIFQPFTRKNKKIFLPSQSSHSPPITDTSTHKRKQASKRKQTTTRRVAQPDPPIDKDTPTEPTKKVLILADSHRRQISSLLSGKLPSNFSITSLFKPNCRFADVTSELDTHTKTLTKRNTVIIIGRQNNIILGDHFPPEQHVDKLQRAAQNTNIVILNLPFWYN